jgi:hypothetical protein
VSENVDVGASSANSCPNGTILVDFAATVGSLMRSRVATSSESHSWSPRWRGYLASAMSGGQWSQARKASVPAWGIDDPNCQLCHAAPGTVEHRFVCRASCPEGGWQKAPKEAELVRGRIGSERLRLLQTRGLLVLRLPAPPRLRQEWFQWTVSPPDSEEADSFTWYLDGSLLDGEWVDYRAVGFGVVVVSMDGSLMGFGKGCPPTWCTTAAAAEAWALATTLSLTPFPPAMRTDCQALLATAQEGYQKAVGANKPLARVWSQIAAAVDEDLGSLVRDERLVWLPAHQTVAAIGSRRLSNGRVFSGIDWRANRLVDALAKQAAGDRQAPPAVTRLLASGKAAVRHAAALLGEVTYTANNFQRVEAQPDGTTITRSVRDAQPRDPRLTQRTPARGAAPPAPPAQLCGDEVAISPSCSANDHVSMVARRADSAAAKFRARKRAEESAHTKRRVAEIGDGAAEASGHRPTATERLHELHRRVIARCGGAH